MFPPAVFCVASVLVMFIVIALQKKASQWKVADRMSIFWRTLLCYKAKRRPWESSREWVSLSVWLGSGGGLAAFARLHESSWDLLGGPSLSQTLFAAWNAKNTACSFPDHTIFSLCAGAIYSELGIYEGFTLPPFLFPLPLEDCVCSGCMSHCSCSFFMKVNALFDIFLLMCWGDQIPSSRYSLKLSHNLVVWWKRSVSLCICADPPSISLFVVQWAEVLICLLFICPCASVLHLLLSPRPSTSCY